MNATPNPSIMTRFAPKVVAEVTPETPTNAAVHDGIVKTKHLKSGMVVRAWFNGAAHGGERVVDTVSRATEDGAEWTVTFSSLHPDQTYKAAYRWFVAELVGAPVDEPARREPAEHLTHRPFAEVLG